MEKATPPSELSQLKADGNEEEREHDVESDADDDQTAEGRLDRAALDDTDDGDVDERNPGGESSPRGYGEYVSESF